MTTGERKIQGKELEWYRELTSSFVVAGEEELAAELQGSKLLEEKKNPNDC